MIASSARPKNSVLAPVLTPFKCSDHFKPANSKHTVLAPNAAPLVVKQNVNNILVAFAALSNHSVLAPLQNQSTLCRHQMLKPTLPLAPNARKRFAST